MTSRLHPPEECTLVKLGGSLLTMPGLRRRLLSNLRTLARYPIVVVGGGGLADVVRKWDQIHQLSSFDSDELARRTLSITADLTRRLLPGSGLVTRFHDAVELLHAGGVPIVDLPAALASSDIHNLPQGWEVTSDSISAAIARSWGLRELILVKSIACPSGDSCENAAAAGLVDDFFPQAAQQLCVRWCDRNQDVWRAETWLNGEECATNMIGP